MSSATDSTENDILNALLRNVPMPTYAKTYIALFTANPGEAGSLASEVSTAAWPSYVRREAEQGGAVGTGWTAAANGVSTNTNQLTWPAHNGAASITITHFAVMYESVAGTVRVYAPLTTPRVVDPGDIFVFDVGTLSVSQS